LNPDFAGSPWAYEIKGMTARFGRLPAPDIAERLRRFKEEKVVRDYFGNVPLEVQATITPFPAQSRDRLTPLG